MKKEEYLVGDANRKGVQRTTLRNRPLETLRISLAAAVAAAADALRHAAGTILHTYRVSYPPPILSFNSYRTPAA